MITRLVATLGAMLLLMAPALAQNQNQNQNQPELYTRPLGKGTPAPNHVSGLPPGSWAAKSRAQVKKALEDKGFRDIIDLHQDQGGWTAKAKKGGEDVTVAVDQKGHVTTK